MKLLTLNTHSLIEPNYAEKLDAFVTVVARLLPDVIALQEVNQTCTASILSDDKLKLYHPCIGSAVIREDNHVRAATEKLRTLGIDYHWTWLPIKRGYGVFDEGLALMSRSPILQTDHFPVSQYADYEDWRTRMLLGVRTDAFQGTWFYTVHYGFFEDFAEPFARQWARTRERLNGKSNLFLMGDFNNPPQIDGQGYDMVRRSGWKDCYLLAKDRDDGITVDREIDGWKGNQSGLRVDQIWHDREIKVTSARVVFDGIDTPTVSDHCGVLITTE